MPALPGAIASETTACLLQGIDCKPEWCHDQGMTKIFWPYDIHQQLLFPPDLQDWLPEGHLARFVSDLVENAMDLSPIYAVYDEEARGGPPYHPAMLVKLLVYGYCTGVRSSRKIERAT